MSDITVVPASSVPSVSTLDPTDAFIFSRDGVSLLKAALTVLFASPAMTGNPTVPTQTAGNSSTRVANTQFVGAAVAAAVGALTTDDISDVSGVDAASPQSLTGALQTLYNLIPRTLFDHQTDAGNTGTAETDLYSDTVPGGTLALDGAALVAYYAGTAVFSATATRRLRAYFGGTSIFDSGAFEVSAAASWALEVKVQRYTSASSPAEEGVRCVTTLLVSNAEGSLSSPNLQPRLVQQTDVADLDLTTAKVLKITGQAGDTGAATNDIVARLGKVQFVPAAV